MTIEQCNSCMYQRTEEQASKLLSPSLCRVYLYPEMQHSRVGGCPMRSHNRAVVTSSDFKLNPLKASKRMREVKK